MTITLTIENVDSLPDGGPLLYQARQHGFEVGREQHLDWTLPDPARYISGRHCEFRYENGAYWLYDVSSNGTFVNGSPVRVKSPYRLAHGDRLSIGHYIIKVDLERDGAAESIRQEARGAPGGPAGYEVPTGDIWDTGMEAPPIADRRDFVADRERQRAPDFSHEFVDLPGSRRSEPQSAAPQSPFAPRVSGSESPFGSAASAGLGTAGEGFVDTRSTPFLDPAAPAFPRPAPQGAPAVASPARAAGPNNLLEALARGAGVPPDAFLGRDPQEVAFEVGEVLRIAIENLTQLLKARAAAKTMTKSASRTMISAADNNPLKFVPVAQEAIEIMFRRNRVGYMGARQSVEEAFADLKSHELATYAAMQKALARLLDELSPETIEAKVGTSAFPLKKGRAWDAFVARWEEKNANANGMLDAFLAYFAEAYDDVTRKK
jgi:type VI secretion system protein ImpI